MAGNSGVSRGLVSERTGTVCAVGTVENLEAAGPGRPRDPSIEDRVIEAAKQELAEHGVDAFSIRSVARRAGVSRPSLGLRWPNRDALIIDTVEKLSEWPTPNPSANVRTELEGIVEHVVRMMEPDALGILMRFVADAPRYPALYARYQLRVMSRAAGRLADLFERAMEAGELPPDSDTVWASDALIGVILMRTLQSPGLRAPSPRSQRRIIDSMWSAMPRRGE
ncbi:TetR/AcrR family transcriptional regulator [Nocardia sp. NBC_01388]|uniref:TetR/AcrR family transcriptional regulator n=1 Tax=Nocardia sp. NBC_01388 TaxID=2903596 RepID=UPI00386E3875